MGFIQAIVLCADDAHAVVVAIGDIQIALGIHTTPMWPIKSCRCSGAVVALTPKLTARNRGHNASGRINTANCVILSIDHQHVFLGVTTQRLGRAPRGGQSRTAITAVTAFASTGKGGDDTVGINFAKPIAATFANVRVTQTIHTDSSRPKDAGFRSGPTVAGSGPFARAGKGGDDTGLQIQTPDALILHVGNQ